MATSAGDLTLFPRPRRLEATGASVHAPTMSTRTARHPSLPEQGYELTIGAQGVDISHADDLGLRYARATLDQIVEQCAGGDLPGLRVSDHPDFAVRGYMLDVSRSRVPTRATLERLVGLCALARLNHLELYTEHTFAYRDHEVVWRDASPITPDDVHWLDQLCKENGIELVPNQNCFGHMGRWLEHDPYRQWAECPDGFEPIAGYTMNPTVLAPTPQNAEFALGLFHELLGNFTSQRVNVDCDETFDLGHGVSRDLVAREGKARVYIDHLKRIVDPLTRDGYSVHYWADIVRKDPTFARELPDDRDPRVLDLRSTRARGGAARHDPPAAREPRCRPPRRVGLRGEHRADRRGRSSVLGRAGDLRRGIRSWEGSTTPPATCSTPPRSGMRVVRPATSSPTGATTGICNLRRSASGRCCTAVPSRGATARMRHWTSPTCSTSSPSTTRAVASDRRWWSSGGSGS